MLRGIETAASENVTQTIHSIATQARPETFQSQQAAEALHHIAPDQRNGRHEHVQPDLLGSDLRPVNYRSQQGSDVARGAHPMALPPRPVANRNGLCTVLSY